MGLVGGRIAYGDAYGPAWQLFAIVCCQVVGRADTVVYHYCHAAGFVGESRWLPGVVEEGVVLESALRNALLIIETLLASRSRQRDDVEIA